MTPDFALACWERALTEDIGIIITLAEADDKREIERALYKARQASGNPDLEALSIAKPGDAPRELWIIKKLTNMEDFR